MRSAVRWRPSVAQFPSGQRDEHRLEARLGDRQVENIEPATLRDCHDASHKSLPTSYVKFERVFCLADPRDALDVTLEDRSELRAVAERLDGDDGVRPDALL